MRKVAVSLLILLVALSSVVMAAADGRVPQASSQGAGSVTRAQPAPNVAWPDAVLWDQPLSSVNQNAYANQDFETAYDAYDVFIADDFVNAEAWTLRNIWVPGELWNCSYCDLHNANTLTWQIYADGGGVPDGNPWAGGAFWSLTLVPSDPQVAIYYGGLGYYSSTWLTPSNPPVIPPGHWWLVFYPQMDFGLGYGQYGRQWSDTTNQTVAQVINPGGGFGFPSYWSAAPPLYGVSQQDVAFRLSGSKALMYVSQFIMSYREPIPGKYKVIGKVQIRESSGPRVAGATVNATWTAPGGTIFPDLQVTNAAGLAAFSYRWDESGTYSLCVTGVSAPGFTYDPSLNPGGNCGYITVP